MANSAFWKDFESQSGEPLTLVAFDLETSGAYPLASEIVEFGAVKWREGQIIDRLQFLVRPKKIMSDFIIGIHGITNEMVQDAQPIADHLPMIAQFFDKAVLMAHHAAFDMGFLAADFERVGRMPNNPVVCTSLVARALIPESANHKLQTLARLLKIDSGTAHRALDDAQSCLEVALHCFERSKPKTMEALAKPMKGFFQWQQFSIRTAKSPIPTLAEAVEKNKDLDIIYAGGSMRGKTRRITPLGLVLSPAGSWLPAICHIDRAEKRFYLDKIEDAQTVER